MFDDLNRYVGWNPTATPTSNSISNPPSVNNTDGQVSCFLVCPNLSVLQDMNCFFQIYTITVLNGATEPWLRKDSMESTTAPSLDIDSILGGFPNYIKQECFSYEDSGFATDSKDNLISPTQPTPPQSNGSQQVQSSTNPNLIMGNGTNRSHVTGQNSASGPRHVIAFQNNNNDWQMSDHNGDQVNVYFSGVYFFKVTQMIFLNRTQQSHCYVARYREKDTQRACIYRTVSPFYQTSNQKMNSDTFYFLMIM